MRHHDLIELGLQLGKFKAPAAAPLGVLESIGKLLTLLRDIIAVVDFADDGALRDRIDACRQAVATVTDPKTVAELSDQCCEACREVLTRIEGQRLDQKREIASLVDLVREALSIVAGDANTFSANLGESMRRFEALGHIDDLRQLKIKLVEEIGALKDIAVERQKTWEKTCSKLSDRVSILERQLTATKREASTDALTRIANRGAFDLACKEWLASDRREFVLGLIDVDNFKGINDTHGHPVGDRVIVAVAQALKNSVRSITDMVARFGGDEFALLAEDLTLQQAKNRLRMLAKSLATLSLEASSNAPLKVTISCGVAEFSAGDTVESLTERADAALSDAKRQGKNRVVGKSKPTMSEMLRQ